MATGAYKRAWKGRVTFMVRLSVVMTVKRSVHRLLCLVAVSKRLAIRGRRPKYLTSQVAFADCT